VRTLRNISTRLVVQDRNSSSEKVCVFTPKWASQPECCGQYWPIVLVAAAQTLTGVVFQGGVKVAVNGFNKLLQVLESGQNVGMRLATLIQEAGRYVSASSKQTSGAKNRTPCGA
jgi:hypothetical protein